MAFSNIAFQGLTTPSAGRPWNALLSAARWPKSSSHPKHNKAGIMFVICPKRKKKKVVFVRLELKTFTLQHDTLPTRLCWRPSHYSTTLYQWGYVELIVFGIHGPNYSFTAGKYIHEATHNLFCSTKQKHPWGSNSWPRVTAWCSTTPKKKRSCVCEDQTHDLHIIARRSTTQ